MDEIATLISKLDFRDVSFGGLIAGILFGGYKGIWVWGSQYRRIEAERDEYKAMTLKLLGIAEKSTNIASSVSGK